MMVLPMSIRSFPILVWLCAVVAGLTPLGVGAEQSSDDQLRTFLAGMDQISAEFRQVLFDVEGNSVRESHGRFFVSRPGRFRWEYEDPMQLVVCDGEKLWMFDQDLEQVTVRSVGETLGGTPAMLLSGTGDLDENFDIRQTYDEDGMSWVEMTPRRESPEFTALRVGLREGQIAVMEVRDSLEQVTRIEFMGLELGADLDDALFRFEPPAGVDVIGEGADF